MMNIGKNSSPQLNTAISAALNAGKSVMKFYNRLDTLKISSKGLHDFVSEADQEAESIVCDYLLKKYPKYNLTAEEGYSNIVDSEYHWYVDPLDGTTNFIHGIPQFAISIGLCKKNIPCLGVIYDPFKNELFAAEQGRGALMNDKKIRVTSTNKIQSALIGTGIPYRKKDSANIYIKTLKSLMDNNCGGIRRLGSAALDLAYVACGRLDGFWEFNLKPWDIVAGSIIVQEAGGHISNIDGNTNFLDSGNIIAANLSLHSDILKNIQGLK